MKKYILPFMSIAMLMAMASCSSSEDAVIENSAEGKLVKMTFTATQESNVGTRTALVTDGNSVIWKEGDKISVFDGVNDTKYNHEFTLSSGDSSPLGSFTGEVYQTNTKGSYYAVYPYTVGATCFGNDVINGITLPSEQTAYENSFDPKAALMMARSSDKNTFNFVNVVSLVKVTTTFPCKRIVLNANEYIAGGGYLFNSANPSFSLTSNKSYSIILKPQEGQDIIAAGTYYIAVSPGKLSSGWSISFTSTDYNVYTCIANSEVKFNSGKIRSIGTFNAETTNWTHTSRGDKVTAEKEVDLGLTITKEDGKKYRVIFANANLTTSGLASSETAYGDYYAWGATEPWYSSISGTTVTGWKEGKTDGYIIENAPFYDSDKSTYTEYTNENDVLLPVHDAARQKLGGDWQIPTKDIWNELYNTSNFNWTFESNGYKVATKDGSKYIFLPAAGALVENSFHDVSSCGYYWSGTAHRSGTALSSERAYYLYLEGDGVNEQSDYYRYCGYTVRPVRLVAE